MKKLYIGIVGYAKLWERMNTIINYDCLMHRDFNVVAYEDEDYMSNYKYCQELKSCWDDYLKYIKRGLIDNLNRIGNYNIQNGNNYEWMNFRKLSVGDLSVMSKHKRIIENFLMGHHDFVLVLEDDAIIKRGAFDNIEKIINRLEFDYLDVAGGDNILTIESNIENIEGFRVEKIETKSTRTACAYILSRRAAESTLRVLKRPCMPIDWSISVALSKAKGLECYWAYDNFIEHGSCIGNVVSWRYEK